MRVIISCLSRAYSFCYNADMYTVKIEGSWKSVLFEESKKPYFKALLDFVSKEYSSGDVYPEQKNMFRAFDLCPLDKVKVVILGQDPYHGEEQANGLSFAVNDGVRLPPSLKNIFKEIQSDLGVAPFESGDLSRWASQGVLLLNATLTVRASNPGSHQKKGWEEYRCGDSKTFRRERKIGFYLVGEDRKSVV